MGGQGMGPVMVLSKLNSSNTAVKSLSLLQWGCNGAKCPNDWKNSINWMIFVWGSHATCTVMQLLYITTLTTPFLVTNNHEQLDQKTQRQTGRQAQLSNIAAARAVADIIRTTLGPRSMLKVCTLCITCSFSVPVIGGSIGMEKYSILHDVVLQVILFCL